MLEIIITFLLMIIIALAVLAYAIYPPVTIYKYLVKGKEYRSTYLEISLIIGWIGLNIIFFSLLL